MEWGAFITVIVAIYLAWYGLNFLYDLFISGKPKVAADSGIQYNISGLVAEEEPARIVTASDYEEEPVDVHKNKSETFQPNPPAAAVIPASSGPSLNIANNPEPVPAPEAVPTLAENTEDWAEAAIKTEEQTTEEKIDIPVQGQSVGVNEYIAALKEQAKNEAASISF